MEEKYEGKDLLLAVEQMDCDKLLHLATKNKSKKSSVSFKGLLSELGEDELEALWEPLSREVEERTRLLLAPSSKQVEHDACQFLKVVIDLGVAYFELEQPEQAPTCTALLAIVVHLNSTLPELPGSLEQLKNSIAGLCEKMFVSREQLFQEHIGLNTLLYILTRSLVNRAAKKEVKRVFALRPLLPRLLPSQEVLLLVKRAAKSPLYTGMMEGQKILEASLTADVDLVVEIHEAIKQKLHYCPLSQASAYGKIYFHAWVHAVKNDLDELKTELEMRCIQNIILLAIQERNKQFVANLRKVLSQFHSQKKEVYVAKMLHFLYQPILWRYIKNPDGIVRANAAQLFLDVFPLEDPDSKVVTTDQELNDQMLLIKDLLLDEYPLVRSTTAIGLCIAISVNWELFSEDMLKTYFRIIINELSCDSSSSDVRCAVAKGLKVVLENPLTHSTMEQLLPKVNHLFHDVSDAVRIAFCQLLIRVKRIAAIKYFCIVHLEHLLGRLGEDPVLSRPLVSLLHNSFLPPGKPPSVWLHRCVEMVKTDRGASRVFFRHCSTHVSLEAIANFMTRIVECVHFYVRSKVCSRRLSVCSSSAQGDVEADKEEEALGLHDPEVVMGLLDGVAILWLANMTHMEQPENKPYLKMVVSKLTKCLGDLSLYYKDTPVWQAVYYLSSFMPSLPSLAPLCFMRLQELPPSTPTVDCITLLECLCAQEGASLVALLLEWLQEGLTSADTSRGGKEDVPVQAPASKKRKKLSKKQQKKKKQEEEEGEEKRHHLALRLFHGVLQRNTCQKALRVAHPDALKGVLHCMEDVKRKVELLAGQEVEKKEAEFMRGLHYLLLKIAVFLRGEDQFNAVKFVEDMLSWLQSKVLRPPAPNSSTRRSLPPPTLTPSYQRMVRGMCEDLCAIMTDMTLLGFFNMKSLKFLKFGMSLLQLDEFGGGGMLVRVCRLLLRHSTRLGEEGGSMMPDCHAIIFQHLGRKEFFDSIPQKDLKESGALLSLTLQQLQGELLSAALVSLVKALLLLSTPQHGEKLNSFKDVTVSAQGTILLSIVCTNPKMILSFLHKLQQHVSKAEMDPTSWVACFAIVNTIQEYKKCAKVVNRELLSLVRKMEGKLRGTPLKSLDSGSNIPPPTTPSKETLSFEEHCLKECDQLRERLKKMSAT